jgi:hypothetical protein
MMVWARGGTLAMAARKFAETATNESAMSQTGGRLALSLAWPLAVAEEDIAKSLSAGPGC